MRTNKLLTIIWQGFMGLAALVGFIFLGFLGPDFTDVGGFLFLFGIICVLLTSFSWARIIEEYNYSSRKEKALKVLHYILGWLGLIILAIVGFFVVIFYSTEVIGQDVADPSTLLFFGGFFAITVALIINALFRNFPSLFPACRDRWPRLWFEDYGFMVFLGVSAIATTLLLTLAPFEIMYVLLLIWNFVALFFFLFLKCRYNKVILGYILVGITALINIVVMIVLSSTIENFDKLMTTDASTMFHFACAGSFILALIMCGPFYAIVEKLHDKLSRNVRSIVFFIVPLVAFGLQYLMYFYWWVALIIVAIMVGVLLLIAFFTPSSGAYHTYYFQDDDGDYYSVRVYY